MRVRSVLSSLKRRAAARDARSYETLAAMRREIVERIDGASDPDLYGKVLRDLDERMARIRGRRLAGDGREMGL